MGYRVFVKGQPPVTVDTVDEAQKLMKATPSTPLRKRGKNADPIYPVEITLSEDDFLRSLPREVDDITSADELATLDIMGLKK